MFVRLLKLPAEVRARYDVSSLRCVIHAAAPCPVPVKQQMIEWFGPVVHEYYAGTEGNGFVYCNSEQWLAHPGTVGRPLVGDAPHRAATTARSCPPARRGTVYFEGGAAFEYHNDPEKTAGSRTRSGWTTLGDVGYLDDDGFLYLTDRKAYMIISGGVNVYPQEAENVLVTHPKVVDVAVFGVPNDDFGEEVKAVVQPVDDAGRRRRGGGAGGRADRLLPHAARRRQVPAHASTSAPSCPATPPASCTSACSRTSTGTSGRSTTMGANQIIRELNRSPMDRLRTTRLIVVAGLAR